MEQELDLLAASVQKRSVDLATPSEDLTADFQRLLHVRARLLRQVGEVGVPRRKPASAAPRIADMPGNMKGLLQHAVSWTSGPLKKGDLAYLASFAPDGFRSELQSDRLARVYRGGPTSTKRAAEQDAAKAALLAEYPELLSGRRPAKKRKTEADRMDGKSRLNLLMKDKLSRAVTKADVVYDVKVVETEDGRRYRARVYLPTVDIVFSCEGGLADSAKGAEKLAAEAALALIEAGHVAALRPAGARQPETPAA